VIRGVVEGAGLLLDLVRAGRSPGREIRRIRDEERLRETEAAWREEIARRQWSEPEPEPAPTTLPSSRDIYADLDDEGEGEP